MLVIFGDPAFHIRQGAITIWGLLRENLQASREVAEQSPNLSLFHGISSHSCSMCTNAKVAAKRSCLDSRLTVPQLALKESRNSVYTLGKGISWYLVSLSNKKCISDLSYQEQCEGVCMIRSKACIPRALGWILLVRNADISQRTSLSTAGSV